MSAKPSKKSASKVQRAPGSAAATPMASSAPTEGQAEIGATVAASAAAPSWIDSSDPRKRMWGKIILAGVWIYVAALWLLALDQTFHWGIFGPKVPPVP